MKGRRWNLAWIPEGPLLSRVLWACLTNTESIDLYIKHSGHVHLLSNPLSAPSDYFCFLSNDFDAKCVSSVLRRTKFCFCWAEWSLQTLYHQSFAFSSPLLTAFLAPWHLHSSLHNISLKMWEKEEGYRGELCTLLSTFYAMPAAWTVMLKCLQMGDEVWHWGTRLSFVLCFCAVS